jgi:DNA-binding transcriptional regulator YiaG
MEDAAKKEATRRARLASQANRMLVLAELMKATAESLHDLLKAHPQVEVVLTAPPTTPYSDPGKDYLSDATGILPAGGTTRTHAGKTPELVAAGQRVRATRVAQGLSRQEFADRLGIAPKTVQQVELGYQAFSRRCMAIVAAMPAAPAAGGAQS